MAAANTAAGPKAWWYLPAIMSMLAGDSPSSWAMRKATKSSAEGTGRVPNNPALIESFWLPTIKEKFGVDMGDQWLKIVKEPGSRCDRHQPSYHLERMCQTDRLGPDGRRRKDGR